MNGEPLVNYLKQHYAEEPITFSARMPFLTLLKKEFLRIWIIAIQTLVTPVVTAWLYLLIFGVSLGNRVSVLEDFSYAEFIVPGLILMGVMQNAFSNSSGSLFMARYLGYIVDLMVAPISAWSMIIAYTLAAMVRGLMVGAVIYLVSLLFVDIAWPFTGAALAMAVLVSFLFSQLGLIVAVYSRTFDGLAMVGNFVLLPAIYLGGLFYPISLLPPVWEKVSMLNPLFYMIEGFRHAALGAGDAGFGLCFGVTSAVSLILFVWAAGLIRSGARLT